MPEFTYYNQATYQQGQTRQQRATNKQTNSLFLSALYTKARPAEPGF